MAASPRKRKCRGCGTSFRPHKNMASATVCSTSCAIYYMRINVAKENKKKDAEKKKQLIPVRVLYSRAQSAFNKYILYRDTGKGCVSCGRADDGTASRHASHYIATAVSSALRFNTYNVHASCQQCNRIRSGNLIKYRVELVNRIGAGGVEWLEFFSADDTLCNKKHSKEYLHRVRKIFARRARTKYKKC